MPTIVQSCRIERDHAGLLSKQTQRRPLAAPALSSLYSKEKAREAAGWDWADRIEHLPRPAELT